MGMYTELIFGAQFKEDTPKEVIDALRYMAGHDIPEPSSYPMKGERNPLNGGSYYFAVTDPVVKMWQDGINGSWILSSRANIKNYEGEIDKFLTWVKPYIEQGSGSREFYAVVTYEESENPTIHYLY